LAQKAEGRDQTTDDGEQRAEDREQRAEDREQMTEVRGQRAEDPSTIFRTYGASREQMTNNKERKTKNEKQS
jgi:hypothetical protein